MRTCRPARHNMLKYNEGNVKAGIFYALESFTMCLPSATFQLLLWEYFSAKSKQTVPLGQSDKILLKRLVLYNITSFFRTSWGPEICSY